MGTPILLFLYAAGAAGIGLGLAAAANGAPGAGFAHMLPSGSKCRYQGGASSSSAASSSTRIGDGGGPVGGIAPAPSPTIRVLNAGSGTTGTTEFFALLCRYGVPSVHYSFHCNLGDNREKVLKAHREVMRLWFCFNSASVGGEVGPSPRIIHSHNCAVRLDPSRSSPGECVRDYMRARLVEALRALVSSGVEGLVDTPYPQMFHLIIALAPDVKVRSRV
mmetsp:Transcript_4650/g.15385  ORF Transcript_4650/g.15385 Transcript_4650/m.15385 type:complete len:220 (+) Transcript_4650:184-843(+)